MTKEKYNKETDPIRHKDNIIILQKIMENIAFLITTNNIKDDESISYFVKNSLETTYIDIKLYLQQKNTDEQNKRFFL